MASTLGNWRRDCYCAEVSKNQAGETLTLMGWVQRARHIGGIVFVWLRDRTGIVQVVFDAHEMDAEAFALAESLRSEFVLAVQGVVRLRSEDNINKQLATGEIEVLAKSLKVLNAAQTPPIYIEEEAEENEAVRLKYRYLDLRRPNRQRMLMQRSQMLNAIRNHMMGEGFVEVETPILTKSTPEGARDYLVPSRLHPGEVYALPQSPQIYKQLLMVGGLDRYFQIARCFRDEDSRADRQPEFSQLDLEMSFVNPEDVQGVVERCFADVFKQLKGIDVALPLPRITWRECMARFGSDKPDLRFGMEIQNLNEVLADSGFSVFHSAIAQGDTVCGIKAEGASGFTRKELDALTDYIKTYHVKGLAWLIKGEDGTVRSSFAKFLSPEALQRLYDAFDAKNGDALFIVADKKLTALTAMGQLRQKLGRDLGLVKADDYKLLWVTEFPLLEYDEDAKRFVAAHHPFTSPMDEDFDKMETDPGSVRAKAYDLVLNGVEMGSGSIRIHLSDLQERMFDLLGFTKEEAWKRFGFLLEAFKYGTPPHGGFAFGIDRLFMTLFGYENLREVIAFPKVQNASCLMMNTPSPVPDEQLAALGISIVKPAGAVEK